MIEAGHFVEVENILRLTLRETKVVKDGLQTFVFSATLSKDLQRNLKKRFRPKGNKKHYKRDRTPASTLDDLLLRLDFRDPTPEIIDQSPVGGIVSTLQEGKIECLSGDKVRLVYF
jgi:ATP-dependent RNA helicase DDX24/MAK5